MKYLVIGFLVLGFGVFAWDTFVPNRPDVTVAPLVGAARHGQQVFRDNCSACHGKNAEGTGNGPPLVHDYYNPGHHGDGAFYAAVERGTRQHHWSFGDMPAQPQVSKRQVAAIIQFIRQVQAANGITNRRHGM